MGHQIMAILGCFNADIVLGPIKRFSETLALFEKNNRTKIRPEDPPDSKIPPWSDENGNPAFGSHGTQHRASQWPHCLPI